jgi:hypothetical protein
MRLSRDWELVKQDIRTNNANGVAVLDYFREFVLGLGKTVTSHAKGDTSPSP